MKLPHLSTLAVRCDAITPIVPNIRFECLVEGKKLQATVTHREDNGLQFIYRIAFSDGHEASFVAPMEGGRWHDDTLASPYAKAIRDDLNAFCGFLPQKPPFVVRVKGPKESFNVWVVPHVRQAAHYAVFYRGDYQFDLRKTHVWEAKSVRDYTRIEHEIAAIVCRNIEQRSGQLQLL